MRELNRFGNSCRTFSVSNTVYLSDVTIKALNSLDAITASNVVMNLNGCTASEAVQLVKKLREKS